MQIEELDDYNNSAISTEGFFLSEEPTENPTEILSKKGTVGYRRAIPIPEEDELLMKMASFRVMAITNFLSRFTLMEKNIYNVTSSQVNFEKRLARIEQFMKVIGIEIHQESLLEKEIKKIESSIEGEKPDPFELAKGLLPKMSASQLEKFLQEE